MPPIEPAADAFRFIAFHLGDQTFAIDSSVVISPHETGVISPSGTFLYEQQQLPVVQAADWIGVDDRGHEGRGHFIIIQSSQGRLAFQIRGISRSLRVPLQNRRPLPAPLNRLVGQRFSAILKWFAVVHEQSERGLIWDSRREERREELFLQVNHESLLSDHVDSAALDISEDESSSPANAISPESSGANARQIGLRQRLFLFSAAQKSQQDREYKFGICAPQLMEVCRPLPIVPVPGAAGHVVGVINWRDQIVPVLRVAEMVGLEGISASKAQRLLIALAPNGRDLLAMQVMADIQSRELPITPIPRPSQSLLASRYLHGAYDLDQETLVIPNLKSMLQLA